MEIYIEYALAENFLLDAMLLWLALKAAKQQISFKRIGSRLCLRRSVRSDFSPVGYG